MPASTNLQPRQHRRRRPPTSRLSRRIGENRRRLHEGRALSLAFAQQLRNAEGSLVVQLLGQSRAARGSGHECKALPQMERPWACLDTPVDFRYTLAIMRDRDTSGWWCWRKP
jgi:hypothetical protein